MRNRAKFLRAQFGYCPSWIEPRSECTDEDVSKRDAKHVNKEKCHDVALG